MAPTPPTGRRGFVPGTITLAHQELHQLRCDPKVESAVLTHPCTRVVFRVGDDDAKKLGDGFESFDARSLHNLEKFHAIARVERNDFDFNLSVRKPEPPADAQDPAASIVEASRRKYATPRAEVEAALLQSIRSEKAAVQPEPPNTRTRASQPTPVVETPKPVSEPKQGTVVSTVSEKKEAVQPPTVPSQQPPRDLGRGGTQHQAIQKRIKEAAEALGFRCIIEKPVLAGQGSIDLWLERGSQSIACEISISTTIDHEVGNVKKCLDAGLSQIAIVCISEDRLQKIAAAVAGSLGPEAATKVAYYQPDPFIACLKSLPLPEEAPVTNRGYTIKRSVPALTDEELRRRDEIANQRMAEAIRKDTRTGSKRRK